MNRGCVAAADDIARIAIGARMDSITEKVGRTGRAISLQTFP